MKKVAILILFVLIFAVFLFYTGGNPTYAQPKDTIIDNVDSVTPLDLKMYRSDLRVVILTLIKSALTFLGILFFVIVLYGGFMWMTAGGNSDRSQKGTKLITNASIGLIIIVLSYAIVVMVFNIINKSIEEAKDKSTYNIRQNTLIVSR